MSILRSALSKPSADYQDADLTSSGYQAPTAAASEMAKATESSQLVPASASTEVNGLKLSFKIRRDEEGSLVAVAGGTNASCEISHVANEIIDPEEAAQLNALYDRMILLSEDYGMQYVQPEAVSMMQRALKAHVRRLLITGSQFAMVRDATEVGGATRRAVRIQDLNAAFAQPTSSLWLPSSQRIPPVTKASATGGRLF